MDRLTNEFNVGDEKVFVYTKGEYEDTTPGEMTLDDIKNVLARLNEYENTGITPKQIYELDKEHTKRCEEVERLKKKAIEWEEQYYQATAMLEETENKLKKYEQPEENNLELAEVINKFADIKTLTAEIKAADEIETVEQLTNYLREELDYQKRYLE